MNGSPRVEVHADAGELATSVAGELLRVLAGAQAGEDSPQLLAGLAALVAMVLAGKYALNPWLGWLAKLV